MNKFIGVGRLAQDPEVRYTQSGTAVASFNIAISSGYGEHKQTDFIPVVAFKNLAEIVGNNLKKGSQVLVEGRMQVRSYETQEGQKRRVTEVIVQNVEFLGSKKSDNDGSSSNVSPESFGTEVFPEEEVPF